MVKTMIPKRQEQPEIVEKRFYVLSTNEVYLRLQQEAYERGVSVAVLVGSVLQAWIHANCPSDFTDAYEHLLGGCTGDHTCQFNLPPSSSLSREREAKTEG